MKLQGLVDGRPYGVTDDAVVIADRRGDTTRLAPLPTPEREAASLADRRDPAALRDPATLRRLATRGRLRRFVERITGQFPAANAWLVAPPDRDRLVATTGPWLCTSRDGGATWTCRRELPDSSAPMGVLPSAFCRTDDALYLGEYPLAHDTTPRVRRSRDGGRSWETTLALPRARHVHAVQRDPYTGDRWVTTGDRNAGCAVGRARDGRFQRVGGGDQRWRAVELAFTPDAVLWGMDCGYARVNRVFRLDRDDIPAPDATASTDAPAASVPDREPSRSDGGAATGVEEGPPVTDQPVPTSVCELDGSVYYSAVAGENCDDGPWVAFATAAETGVDSTAPETVPRGSDRVRVVCASAASGYEEWAELATYRRAPALGDRPGLGALPRANAYAFLAGDDDGLFVNPYNTRTDHGRVDRYSVAWLREIVP